MAYGNSTELIGNATRDPELKYTPGGMAVATFGLAVNRKVGEEERVSFFECVCFGDFADNVATSVAKGMRLVIVGRLEQRSWENEDGDRRSKVEVVVDELGPSLRWATAEVQKNERADTQRMEQYDEVAGQGQQAQQGRQQQGRQQRPAGRAQGQQRPQQRQPAPPPDDGFDYDAAASDYDEEPF